MRIDFLDGYYIGEAINEKPHGYGTTYKSDGTPFSEGNFFNGKMHGEGTLYNELGQIEYKGSFHDGQKHGWGVLYMPGLGRYEGDFYNDEPHGQGTVLLNEGITLTGRFFKSKLIEGEKHTHNGWIYKGSFKDHKLNGNGALIFPNGTVIEGNFVDDTLCSEGVMRRPDGMTFKGEFKDFIPYKGECKFADGSIMRGDFVDSLLHGQGEIIYANGKIERGHFVKQKLHGQGEVISSDGFVIKGSFLNGKVNGYAVALQSGELIYEGEFLNDLQHGKGTLYHINGEIYRGTFINGKRDRGAVFFPNDEFALTDKSAVIETRLVTDQIIYMGELKDNIPNGFGSFIFKSGQKEMGEIVNGYLEGFGVRIFTNGMKYVGYFKKHKLHGKGTLYLPNKFKCVGDFADDKLNGSFTIYNASGRVTFEGNYVNSKRNGYGVEYYSDGYTYKGSWKDDEMDGSGTIYGKDGSVVYSGSWKNSAKHGYGKEHLSDGRKYEGYFEYNTYHGHGVLKDASGNVEFDGVWNRGKKQIDGLWVMTRRKGESLGYLYLPFYVKDHLYLVSVGGNDACTPHVLSGESISGSSITLIKFADNNITETIYLDGRARAEVNSFNDYVRIGDKCDATSVTFGRKYPVKWMRECAFEDIFLGNAPLATYSAGSEVYAELVEKLQQYALQNPAASRYYTRETLPPTGYVVVRKSSDSIGYLYKLIRSWGATNLLLVGGSDPGMPSIMKLDDTKNMILTVVEFKDFGAESNLRFLSSAARAEIYHNRGEALSIHIGERVTRNGDKSVITDGRVYYLKDAKQVKLD